MADKKPESAEQNPQVTPSFTKIDFNIPAQQNEPSIWETLKIEDLMTDAQNAIKKLPSLNEVKDEFQDKLDLATAIYVNLAVGVSPTIKELTDHYVTKQSTKDRYSRQLAWPGRVEMLKKKMKEGTLEKYQIQNLQDLDTFMTKKTIADVFGAELKGLHTPKTPEDIQDRLRTVFMGETQLGQRNKAGKLIDNPGGAVGLLQVEPSTFRDVVKQTQFGSKAAAASGLTQSDLNIIKNTPDNKLNTLSKYLEQPKVNYMAATARILQYLKHHKL